MSRIFAVDAYGMFSSKAVEVVIVEVVIEVIAVVV
jgi:hypothetical protein